MKCQTLQIPLGDDCEQEADLRVREARVGSGPFREVFVCPLHLNAAILHVTHRMLPMADRSGATVNWLGMSDPRRREP